MTTDKETLYLGTKIVCSSNTINELLKSGGATFVIHVECSNTLFRRAYEFTETEHQIPIPRDNLNDDVEVNTFVRAKRDLPGYQIIGSHPDYGDAKFDVRTCDILAVGEGCVFPIESTFDSMSRIGSIFLLKEANKEGDIPMQMDPNHDKIVITLSKPDFKIYKQLKSHDSLSALLTTSLVLPVLIEALDLLREDTSGADDHRRWVRVLSRRIEQLGLDKTAEPLILAQQLLENPIKRSLVGANVNPED
jgi:hypothetical protein